MVSEELLKNVQAAKEAFLHMSTVDVETKNLALKYIQDSLKEQREVIVQENRKDKDGNKGAISDSLYSRLDLEKQGKIESLISGVDSLIQMNDPVGQVTLARELADNLTLIRRTVPLGVILIIFESRPEALVQIATLCIKSGNAVILKGGKEAAHSNAVLTKLIQGALEKAGLPKDAVQLITSRDEVSALLSLNNYINLVIPRGSNSLVRYIQEHTSIPVLGHADGICTTYIDESADLKKAVSCVVDAKTNYPSACNTTETLLVNKNSTALIAPIVKALQEKNVTIKVAENIKPFVKDFPNVVDAEDKDFDTEFCAPVIAIKMIDGVKEAIMHINAHGSGHTDCIITENELHARMFMNGVDAAGVFHNASTRFADGFRYGFGAEIGVSTNKTHARGPVGMEGLVIYKYTLHGDGHIVGDFSSGAKHFTHKNIDGAAAAAQFPLA
eukprot:GCRY01001631.1.p1 GENE.GCRY01001631.1~~GCRY01001631.1.p1  ORF type:complete len:444 (-),score=129.04 GCRY01001631.1:484-1815(-)